MATELARESQRKAQFFQGDGSLARTPELMLLDSLNSKVSSEVQVIFNKDNVRMCLSDGMTDKIRLGEEQ